MVGKSAKVISIDRVVDANLNIRDFDHRPAQIRQWFSNNIIRPAFAHLVGWTGTRAVMLRSTTAGVLKVADVGSGLEQIETDAGVAGAVESGDQVFGEIASKVRIIANDFGMYFRPSRDGTNFEDQIHVLPDIENVFEITCAAYRVQRYGANDVLYEVEGYR